MKRFILLLNHDDLSLTAYLQHCMEKGEQFIKASGNIFSFSKNKVSGEQIAVVTYVNEDPDLKMKFQMEDYSALMKKRGWKTVCIGKPEDIFDSKRHVFLQTNVPDAPDPLRDPKQIQKASKRETGSLIRCIAMLLFLLGFGIFFLSHDPDIFLSSNHILILCLAGFAAWIYSLICCLTGIVIVSRKLQCADGFRHYLVVDKAVLFCMISVGMLFAALVVDTICYPDTSRTIVRGENRITVYQDTVPLSLEDLSLPVNGIYRSSRFTERSGFLMKSKFGSDQSFSDPETSDDLSLISYSVYQSDYKFILDWVGRIKGLKNLSPSKEMAEQWNSSEVHTDGRYRFSACYPRTLLVFSTTASLESVSAEIVLRNLGLIE